MIFNFALVTGATSGIGEALCHILADKKINLIITGRNEEKLRELKNQLQSKVDVQTLVADLADENQTKQLLSVIRDNVPDLVINNAGFGFYGAAIEDSLKKQADILKVNGLSLLEITIEAAGALRKANKKGVILNVSSVAAFFPFPYFSTYSASKAFVNQFSENMDYELKYSGIRVLAACPGMVKTAFVQRAGGVYDQEDNYSMSPEFAAEEIWNQIVKLKKLHIFNFKYKLAVILSRFLPKFVLAKMLMNQIKERL